MRGVLFLYQVLIELTDVNALSALYYGLFFGVTVKLLWAWNVEYSFIGSMSEPANTKISHPLFFYQTKNYLHDNMILFRIMKYIRRKKCTPDDSEEPISFLVI
jgi:hypothetical protein